MRKRSKSESERNYIAAVGIRISELRKSRGMKCREFASKIGIGPSVLYSYESGQNSCPIYRLKIMALRFDVPIAQLIPNTTIYSFFSRDEESLLVSSTEQKTAVPDGGRPEGDLRLADLKIIEIGKPQTRMLTLELVERIFEDMKLMPPPAVAEKYGLLTSSIENLANNAEVWDFKVRQEKALQTLRNLEGTAK